MTAGAQVRGAARSATDSAAIRVLARCGFAASALIHLLLGYVAVRVALHHGGRSDPSGAISTIGHLPGGPVLLWAMTVGLLALAAWLILQAVLGIGSGAKQRWARSAVSAAKAVAYLALGLTALAFARGSSSNSRTSTQHASADLLSLPGGQALLVVVGLGAVGVGIYLVAKGARRGFEKDLDLPGGRVGTAVTVLGVIGYVAKGIAIVAVGVLFVVAALTLDPDRASGLDGALKAFTALPFGSALLVGIGAGLMAFGVYTFARARYGRL